MNGHSTVDDYIASYPADVQVVLETIRQTIRKVVPTADETISYQIPTFRLNGKNIVHFAAWKHHISLYPLPAIDEEYEQEVAPYRSGKGTAKFPLDKPIPYDIIERMVGLLVEERSAAGERIVIPGGSGFLGQALAARHLR